MAIHAKKTGLMVSVRILEDNPGHWHVHAVDEVRPKYISKDGKQGRVFPEGTSIKEIEAWINSQRKPKASVLTNAQVLTLSRMASGTRYMATGNGRRALERRNQYRVGFDDVNAPSIPPLIRKGLVELDPRYTHHKPDSYYPVVLTEAGIDMIEAFKKANQ